MKPAFFGPFYHNGNPLPVCLWPKSNAQHQNNAVFPLRYDGSSPEQHNVGLPVSVVTSAWSSAACCQDTYNCSLAALPNVRLNTAFRKWSDPTRLVCVRRHLFLFLTLQQHLRHKRPIHVPTTERHAAQQLTEIPKAEGEACSQQSLTATAEWVEPNTGD